VLKKTHGKTKAHGKVMVCRVLFLAHGKEILCRVFFCDTRQSHGLPCAFFLAHGKAIKFFLSSHFETFSTLHIQHVALHVKI